MQPTSPLLVNLDGEPNLEILRRLGWSLSTVSGAYCVAWRGNNEVVLEWKAGGWHRLGGAGKIEDDT